METYKLQMKVGPHEFHGEGPEDAVKKDFEEWKSLIASTPTIDTARPATVPPALNSASWSAPIESEQLARIFLLDDKKGLVTLRILPRGDDRDRDAVLLILLGFRRLKDQDEVLVTQLKPALKQSGCNVDRVDSVVAKYLREGLINKGGMAKGGRYSLTNSGAEKAAALVHSLLA